MVERARAPHSILIVDDDAPLLDAVRRGFEHEGIDVTASATFEEGRQALRTRHFDAMITDVRLGAFNGLQLVVVARNDHPDMKLVVFSGYDDPVLRAEAERVGATYLVKPVGVADLMKHLGFNRD